ARCARAPFSSLRSRPLQLAALAPPSARCARAPSRPSAVLPHSTAVPWGRNPVGRTRISSPTAGWGRYRPQCRRWSQGLVPHEVGEGTVAPAGGGAKDQSPTKWGKVPPPKAGVGGYER